ncbi:unnamed protein product [Trichogramma brassicae]|uniref:Uncharacterized protein n=1 Tax=Trichogramma brassicae TaxID=86971 RepID=A0A6H5IR82_9HYME|nr:unnamed protein product [Trichogramma brassicae]
MRSRGSCLGCRRERVRGASISRLLHDVSPTSRVVPIVRHEIEREPDCQIEREARKEKPLRQRSRESSSSCLRCLPYAARAVNRGESTNSNTCVYFQCLVYTPSLRSRATGSTIEESVSLLYLPARLVYADERPPPPTSSSLLRQTAKKRRRKLCTRVYIIRVAGKESQRTLL